MSSNNIISFPKSKEVDTLKVSQENLVAILNEMTVKYAPYKIYCKQSKEQGIKLNIRQTTLTRQISNNILNGTSFSSSIRRRGIECYLVELLMYNETEQILSDKRVYGLFDNENDKWLLVSKGYQDNKVDISSKYQNILKESSIDVKQLQRIFKYSYIQVDPTISDDNKKENILTELQNKWKE